MKPGLSRVVFSVCWRIGSYSYPRCCDGIRRPIPLQYDDTHSFLPGSKPQVSAGLSSANHGRTSCLEHPFTPSRPKPFQGRPRGRGAILLSSSGWHRGWLTPVRSVVHHGPTDHQQFSCRGYHCNFAACFTAATNAIEHAAQIPIVTTHQLTCFHQ